MPAPSFAVLADGSRYLSTTVPPVGLAVDLCLPPSPKSVVVFAHGSGSSRLSPRNRSVAEALRGRGLATLLFDLLTPDEALDRRLVFDIPLLAERLVDVTLWLRALAALQGVAVGFFGASTGAAAALVAATVSECEVAAVVSRGGRPDLAMQSLAQVRAPTLLIVGGDDTEVLALNRLALAELRCAKSLAIVPGASHLFEEEGTLDQVIALAQEWFLRHLAGPSAR